MGLLFHDLKGSWFYDAVDSVSMAISFQISTLDFLCWERYTFSLLCALPFSYYSLYILALAMFTSLVYCQY